MTTIGDDTNRIFPPPLPTPQARPFSFRRWFRHFNPFYPVSAGCMFVGCFALAQSMRLSPGKAGQLLALVGTVMVYQVLLIALGLTLVRRWHAARDGRFLLLLMLLFAVDPAYLIGELASSQSAYAGFGFAWIGLASASAMIGYSLRRLRIVLSLGAAMMIGLQIAGVMLLPWCLARLSDHGDLARSWAYAGWWLLGAMLALQECVIGERRLAGRMRQVDPPVRWALVTLPMAGLILHMVGASWVFHADYSMTFVSPLLLGLAIWLPHAVAGRRARSLTMPWQFVLPMIAMMFSFGDAEHLSGTIFRINIDPPVLTFIGCLIVFAHAWWAYRVRFFGWLLVALPILVFGGKHIDAIAHACQQAVYWLANHLLPRTVSQWGLLGVIVSFVMLGVGTLLNYRRQQRRSRA